MEPKLAIWLSDVERLPPQMRLEMYPHLDLNKIHRTGKGERIEESPTLAFKCPLLQAALICDVVRSHDRKVGARPSELFVNRSGDDDGWRRIVYGDMLTVVVNGRAILNPAVFGGTVMVDEPAEVRPLMIGRKR